MTEHPILFQDRLVEALLEGRKTQTRRVGPSARRWLKAEEGDTLWVREAWQPFADAGYIYRAGPWHGEPDLHKPYSGWKPSIHMPRRACRLELRLREKPYLQRLQDMTEADAKAEGVKACATHGRWLGPPRKGETEPGCFSSARDAFASLWDGINAPRGFGWTANPDVVVLRFWEVPT